MDSIPSAITADGCRVMGSEFVSFLALNSERSYGIDGTRSVSTGSVGHAVAGDPARMKDCM